MSVVAAHNRAMRPLLTLFVLGTVLAGMPIARDAMADQTEKMKAAGE